MKLVDPFSLVSLPLELWFGESYLSNATGFFWKHGDSLFLISNWHVLTGRNALTGQPLHSQGAIPDRLRLSLHSEPIGASTGPYWLDLVKEDANLWLQHHEGQSYDIACIRIQELPRLSRLYFPSDQNCNERLFRRVGADCFVVGYPIRGTIQEMLPIWKRATIATEPDLPFRGVPCILVDTTTTSGMSGSPVYLRQSGTVLYDNGEVAVVTGSQTEFLGIYSGRMKRVIAEPHDHRERVLDIGFVWPRSLIEEMCRSPHIGSHELRNA